MTYLITRQIELDAGHRIPEHNSKCRNIHGHRYRVELAVASDQLQTAGSSTGMIVDFGFMKKVMMQEIHDICDHRLMLYFKDPLLELFLDDEHKDWMVKHFEQREPELFLDIDATGQEIARLVSSMPIVICGFVPTAENLAKAWYEAVKGTVERTIDRPPDYVKVWETPNSTAMYKP